MIIITESILFYAINNSHSRQLIKCLTKETKHIIQVNYNFSLIFLKKNKKEEICILLVLSSNSETTNHEDDYTKYQEAEISTSRQVFSYIICIIFLINKAHSLHDTTRNTRKHS